MRNNLVGLRFDTKCCGMLSIIAMESNTRCTVKFDTTGTVRTNIHTREIRNGEVGDPYYPKIFGVACLGVGKWKSKCGNKNSREYNIWYAMLARCYSGRYDSCYDEVVVCRPWLNFQFFCESIKNVKGYDLFAAGENVHLDKDELALGQKIYSESTCQFIPERDNCTTYGNTSKVLYSFQGTKGIYTTTSLRTFAETYSLNRKKLAALVKGESSTYKGLVFISKEPLTPTKD